MGSCTLVVNIPRTAVTLACSVGRGATPKDYRVLPPKIILVRHAESEGNVDNFAYTYVPDPQVPLVRSLLDDALAVLSQHLPELDHRRHEHAVSHPALMSHVYLGDAPGAWPCMGARRAVRLICSMLRGTSHRSHCDYSRVYLEC